MRIIKSNLALLVTCIILLVIGAGAYFLTRLDPHTRKLIWKQVSVPPEEHFINMLRQWAQKNNDKFPDHLSLEEMEKLYTASFAEYDALEKELEPKLQKLLAREEEIIARLKVLKKELPDTNEIQSMSPDETAAYVILSKPFAEERKLRKELYDLGDQIDEYDSKLAEGLNKPRPSFDEMMEYDLTMAEGMRFFRSLGSNNNPYYNGRGVPFGDSNTAIFWYKPKKNKDRYRVIYGDLSIKEQTAEPSPATAEPSINI